MQNIKQNGTRNMEKNSHVFRRNVRLKKHKNTGQGESRRKQIYEMKILEKIQFKNLAKIKEHKKWFRQHHQAGKQKRISLAQLNLYALL